MIAFCRCTAIPHSINCKGNQGYKPLAQQFVGSFGWTIVSYDWSMVFPILTNACPSETTQKYPCAENLYPFPLYFLEWGITE